MDVSPLFLDLLEEIPRNADAPSPSVRQAATELARTFEQARRLYEGRDYRDAADVFMAAARAARGHDALAANRASCYRNATKAWYMAAVLHEKRPLLDEAAREDPLCGAEIRRMLEILD